MSVGPPAGKDMTSLRGLFGYGCWARVVALTNVIARNPVAVIARNPVAVIARSQRGRRGDPGDTRKPFPGTPEIATPFDSAALRSGPTDCIGTPRDDIQSSSSTLTPTLSLFQGEGDYRPLN